MNKDKIGETISVFVSTFLTVYVALRIGKAIGRREVVEEVTEVANREIEEVLRRGRERSEPVTRYSERPNPPEWWIRDVHTDPLGLVYVGIVGASIGGILAIIVSIVL